MARKASTKSADSTANLGFEAKPWGAAYKLRNNMDGHRPPGGTNAPRRTLAFSSHQEIYD